MSEAVHCFKWTDELTATLLRLQAQGLTSQEMARFVGQGCTRNAICGRLYRLRQAGADGVRAARPMAPPKPARLPKRKLKTVSVAGISLGDTPFAQRGRSYNLKGPAKPRAPKAAELEAPDTTAKVSLMGLTSHTCRWPLGDPLDKDFGFCGHEPRGASPYCAWHAEKAIRPRETRGLPPIPLPNFNGLSK
jgi:GcrA cell cycle regulator